MEIQNFVTPHKKRVYNPDAKDQQVHEYLQLKHEQGDDTISFHQIQMALGLSPGALQAVINRCLKSDSQFRIYESTGISDKNKRFTRLFSVVPLNVPPPISNLHYLLNNVQQLKEGDIIDLGEFSILPLKLDKMTLNLLSSIPKISKEYSSISILFKSALEHFFKDQLSPELKKQALQYLRDSGLLSKPEVK